VLVCGAVLMALEIVGSRILSPYFGNSIFVWGSLISVVLAALSLGYFLGGLVADRLPRLSTLAAIIAAAGASVFYLPFFYPALNQAIAMSDLGVRLGPLLVSTILFLIPGVLLGMVSPFAVRLRATAVMSVGTTAGVLYGLSTLGSIIGTLLTAFFLIPAVGIRGIVHGLGIALLVTALPLALLAGDRVAAVVLAAVALVASILASRAHAAPGPAQTVYEADTFYHSLRVVEDGPSRFLFFDSLRQSGVDLEDPSRLRLPYTRYVPVATLFPAGVGRVLVVGLGGGSIPRWFRDKLPDAIVDVVEIDPEVVRVAERYFGLRPDTSLRVRVGDGRLFPARSQDRYDLIVLDAYNGDTIPPHLVTREYFAALRRRLPPEGVVVSNVIGSLAGPQSRLVRAVARTVGTVFPQLYVFRVGGYQPETAAQETNILIVASQGPGRVSMADLMARGQPLAEGGKLPLPLAAYARAFVDKALDIRDVPILTDDYAPVESLMRSE
jgi:spermidine synthase